MGKRVVPKEAARMVPEVERETEAPVLEAAIAA